MPKIIEKIIEYQDQCSPTNPSFRPALETHAGECWRGHLFSINPGDLAAQALVAWQLSIARA